MEEKIAPKFYLDAIKFSHGPRLDIMQELCHRLGDPQKKCRFVHVAGTNGKGSCAAMLAAMLRAEGKKTGLYTSPNLVAFGERIQINGVNITPDQIAARTPAIAAAAADLPAPSFFELVTALAFSHFAVEDCDVVVLECGLGGLWDATNIIPPPLCSVVMPVAMDHAAVMGGTLQSIAREKAGILKAGAPAVIAPQTPEAMTVLSRRCKELEITPHLVDIKQIIPLSYGPEGQQFHYKKLKNLRLSLLGSHQLQNAAAAIEAAEILGLSELSIRQGLQEVHWPCRFELAQKAPPFILDAAHNPHGAAALAAGLRDYFPGEKFCFILGVLQDKDWPALLPHLTPLAAEFLCITPESPRALPAAELAAAIEGPPAWACESLEEALALAKASGHPVCACGSLYYIGYLRQLLLPRKGDTL